MLIDKLNGQESGDMARMDKLWRDLFNDMEDLCSRTNKVCQRPVVPETNFNAANHEIKDRRVFNQDLQLEARREDIFKEFYPHLRSYVNLAAALNRAIETRGNREASKPLLEIRRIFSQKLDAMIASYQRLIDVYPVTSERLLYKGAVNVRHSIQDDRREKMRSIILQYRNMRSPDTI